MGRLFTILFFLSFSIISAFAESSKSDDVIKIGVYDDPPMVFSENGIIKGINPEIFEAVALKKGIKYEYVWGSWSEIYNGVIDGHLDMVFDIAKTKEREAFLDFNNETIITAWGVIMSRRGVKISSMADLIDKKISAVADDVYYEGHPDSFKEMMQTFGYRCQYLEFGGFTEAANAVINGKADACVLAKSYADYQLKGSYLEKTPIIFKPIKFISVSQREGAPEQSLSLILTGQYRK